MEAIKKIDEQEKDTLELVLKEILEEQQKANNINTDNVPAINQLIITVANFNERLENLKIISSPVSTKPYEEIIKKGIADMQLAVGNQPKSVTRKFQFLLFPEQDAKLFYKIVFGRWLMWFTVILFINNLYKWSIHWSDNQKEIKQQQLQRDRIKKAWNYLYFQETKSIKKLMDSVYLKSEKGE